MIQLSFSREGWISLGVIAALFCSFLVWVAINNEPPSPRQSDAFGTTYYRMSGAALPK